METLELGGNIQLTGFSDIGSAKLIVVKKIVGNYARKFSDKLPNFEQLCVTCKQTHTTENSTKYELDVKLMDNGKPIVSDYCDRNLFICLDNALKKAESQLA